MLIWFMFKTIVAHVQVEKHRTRVALLVNIIQVHVLHNYIEKNQSGLHDIKLLVSILFIYL